MVSAVREFTEERGDLLAGLVSSSGETLSPLRYENAARGLFLSVGFMPELPEVEKLRRQLEPAWTSRTIVGITAPEHSKVNANKFFSPKASDLRLEMVKSVSRVGKFLWIQFYGRHALKIHLSSTGWFTPGNEEARQASKLDPIVDNFIHKISSKNVRCTFHLGDGQQWRYHDPRTWGKFTFLEASKPQDDSQIAALGPDWLTNRDEAVEALQKVKSGRTAKDVLTDQHIACGVGNYLAVEALHDSRIHPHTVWNKLHPADKAAIAVRTGAFIDLSLEKDDHSHWKVFGKTGEDCPSCKKAKIAYAKDGSAKRGSYFCTWCQR